jgi:hypothetical protein
MRIKIAVLALVAAVTVLPTLNSPAEAKHNRFHRTFNRIYNPYPYGYYSAYQARQAAAQQLIDRVNAAIAAGQITVQQGNQILVRGHW